MTETERTKAIIEKYQNDLLRGSKYVETSPWELFKLMTLKEFEETDPGQLFEFLDNRLRKEGMYILSVNKGRELIRIARLESGVKNISFGKD